VKHPNGAILMRGCATKHLESCLEAGPQTVSDLDDVSIPLRPGGYYVSRCKVSNKHPLVRNSPTERVKFRGRLSSPCSLHKP